MAIANSTQLATGVPAATAGLAGGPSLARSTELQGHLQIAHANFVVPASGAGSASGDQIILALLNVFARIYYIAVGHSAWSAAVTLAIGKTDPNNSANNDNNHYASPTDVSLVGTFLAGGQNIGEQVGTDPAGDQSTGNTSPGFGSKDIQITATIAGTPTAAATLSAVIFYVSRP